MKKAHTLSHWKCNKMPNIRLLCKSAKHQRPKTSHWHAECGELAYRFATVQELAILATERFVYKNVKSTLKKNIALQQALACVGLF